MVNQIKRLDREILKYPTGQTVHLTWESMIYKIIITSTLSFSHLWSHLLTPPVTSANSETSHVYFTVSVLRSCFVPSKMMNNYLWNLYPACLTCISSSLRILETHIWESRGSGGGKPNLTVANLTTRTPEFKQILQIFQTMLITNTNRTR